MAQPARMRLTLSALLILTAACSAQPEAEDPQIAKGKAIAEANCASCHAIDAVSQSQHTDAPAFRTLSERYPVDNLQEALAEGIVVGHEDMPEFSFDPDDVDALIAFMESLQTVN